MLDNQKDYENEIYRLRAELSFYKGSRIIGLLLSFKKCFKKLKLIITHPIMRLKNSLAHRLDDNQKKIIRNLIHLDFLRIKIPVKNVPYDGPIVSVITPFYNNDATILETYDSVINQTLQNFEYIVVDDGSDKHNTAVLKKINDRRSRVIRHPENLGKGSPAAARNTGISKARGKYILCLDADDIIDSTYLEKLVFVLENDPNASIAVPDMEKFGVGSGTYSFGRFIPEKLINKNIVNTASLFRREDWNAIGGYKEGIGYEDWEFWVNLVEHGFWGRHVNEPLLHYRTALNSRYVEDLSSHKNNVKKIHSLHRFYWLKIKVLRLKKFIFKKVLIEKDRYVNLESSLDLRTNKKVLVLLPWLTFGGAEKLVLNFCDGLKDKYDFSFITVLKSNNEWQQRFSKITRRIYHLPNILDSRTDYYNFLKQYIELNHVSIVHVVHVGYLFDAFEVAKLIKNDFPNVKIIFTFFNSEVPLFKKIHECERYIDAVTSDSCATAEIYSKSYPNEKIWRIANGIDVVNKFNPSLYNHEEVRKSLGIDKDKIAVLYLGRLSSEKNIDGIFDLAKKINNKNMQFFIVGDGPLSSQVKSQVKENVVYLGYRDDVASIMSAMDLFFLPSFIEGSPQTIIEAMASGLPVASSSVGDIPYLIKENVTGVLFNPYDIEEVVLEVGKIVDNLNLRKSMAREARKYAVECHSLDAMVKKYSDLYSCVLENNKRKN